MAENLAYKPLKGGYWSYAGSSFNGDKYGYLYDWETACKVCPEGWHLPSDKDWKELEVTMGMSPSDAESIEWRGTYEGNVLRENDGFSAIFSGARNIRGSFHSLGTHGYWWSSTENSNKAWRRFIDTYESKIYRSTLDNRTGLSVRCLKSKNDDKEFLTKEVEKVKGFSSSVIKSNEKWKGIKDSLYIHKSLGTFYRLPVNYVSYGLHESNKAKIDMVLYDSIYGRPLGNLRRNESVEISNYEYHFYDFDKAVVHSCNNTVFDGCKTIIELSPGDTILLLNSAGESAWDVLHNGQLTYVTFSNEGWKLEAPFYDGCNMITGRRLTKDSNYILWMKARLSNGKVGYLKFDDMNESIANYFNVH